MCVCVCVCVCVSVCIDKSIGTHLLIIEFRCFSHTYASGSVGSLRTASKGQGDAVTGGCYNGDWLQIDLGHIKEKPDFFAAKPQTQ